MQSLKNKQGFTLVEVVVYLAVSAIILGFIGSLVFSASNMFANDRARNEAKQVGDAVYSYMVEELRYATTLGLDAADGTNTLTVSGGRLLLDGTDPFGEAAYLGNTVELGLQESASLYAIGLTLRVLDSSGQERYSAGSTVELINMKHLKTPVVTFAPQTDPTIYYTKGVVA